MLAATFIFGTQKNLLTPEWDIKGALSILSYVGRKNNDREVSG